MTLPTSSPMNNPEDDSDMFGPPRSSPIGYHHQRSRIPMISPKLRQREERKRILQLCAHKLERIKDSETNLRRSVCINNTYSRLTDEVRREKQSRYLANLPKSENHHMYSQRDSIFSPYSTTNRNISHNNSLELRNNNFPNAIHQKNSNLNMDLLSTTIMSSTLPLNNARPITPCPTSIYSQRTISSSTSSLSLSSPSSTLLTLTSSTEALITTTTIATTTTTTLTTKSNDKLRSSCNVDTDLEILDRELNAINASMPLIDPEITQGAEQLEKAMSSRKRLRNEDENDRLVREALSQFYIPTQRLISAIDDCPLDIKRQKIHNINNNNINNNNNNNNGINMNNNNNNNTASTYNHCSSNNINSGDIDLDLALDLNQTTHKEFEVIMDALRIGTGSPAPSANDSCGQAAMMSESGVFHNLVVTSLET